jgi:hypothetical protein
MTKATRRNFLKSASLAASPAVAPAVAQTAKPGYRASGFSPNSVPPKN